MKPFDYAIAENEGAAVAALGKGYKVKAGGIDLLDRLKERTEESEKLVSIHRVEALKGIREVDGGIAIGALTTLRQMSESELLRKKFPALAHAAGDAATPQIRAVATAGGNLCQRPRCWYFRAQEYQCLKKRGSTCFAVEGENAHHALFGGGPCHIVHPSNIAPPLVAANALFVVKSPAGERTIPAREFFTLPQENMYAENVLKANELIAEIRVPKLPAKSAYLEVRHKQSFDWPLASCAAVFMNGAWSVVLGAVAPIPWRVPALEKALGGNGSLNEETAGAAAPLALEGANPMSQNGWRQALVTAVVKHALVAASLQESAG